MPAEVAEAAEISDSMSDLSEEITIDLVVAALLITSATITMVVTMSATSHQVAEVSTEDSTIEEERITSAMQAELEAEEDLMEGTGHLHPTMASAEEAIEVEEVASRAKMVNISQDQEEKVKKAKKAAIVEEAAEVVEEEEVTEMKEKKVLLRKRRELISKEEQSTTKEIQDNNGTSLIGKTELEEAEELLKEAMERLTGATLRTLSNLVRM